MFFLWKRKEKPGTVAGDGAALVEYANKYVDVLTRFAKAWSVGESGTRADAARLYAIAVKLAEKIKQVKAVIKMETKAYAAAAKAVQKAQKPLVRLLAKGAKTEVDALSADMKTRLFTLVDVARRARQVLESEMRAVLALVREGSGVVREVMTLSLRHSSAENGKMLATLQAPCKSTIPGVKCVTDYWKSSVLQVIDSGLLKHWCEVKTVHHTFTPMDSKKSLLIPVVAGQSLTVLAQCPTWSFVQTSAGKLGYVPFHVTVALADMTPEIADLAKLYRPDRQHHVSAVRETSEPVSRRAPVPLGVVSDGALQRQLLKMLGSESLQKRLAAHYLQKMREAKRRYHLRRPVPVFNIAQGDDNHSVNSFEGNFDVCMMRV